MDLYCQTPRKASGLLCPDSLDQGRAWWALKFASYSVPVPGNLRGCGKGYPTFLRTVLGETQVASKPSLLKDRDKMLCLKGTCEVYTGCSVTLSSGSSTLTVAGLFFLILSPDCFWRAGASWQLIFGYILSQSLSSPSNHRCISGFQFHHKLKISELYHFWLHLYLQMSTTFKRKGFKTNPRKPFIMCNPENCSPCSHHSLPNN